MKCFYCDTEVRWNNDFDTDDQPEFDHEIVSMYECDKCKSWYEVYHTLKDKTSPKK